MIRECFSYHSDKNTTGGMLESDGSGLVGRVSGDARQRGGNRSFAGYRKPSQPGMAAAWRIHSAI